MDSELDNGCLSFQIFTVVINANFDLASFHVGSANEILFAYQSVVLLEGCRYTLFRPSYEQLLVIKGGSGRLGLLHFARYQQQHGLSLPIMALIGSKTR